MIDKIKYLGREITVEHFKEHLCNSNMGGCDSAKDIISINDDMTQNKRQETVLHELIHLISDDFAMDFDEKTVSTLTNVLYGIFIDNKDIIENI